MKQKMHEVTKSKSTSSTSKVTPKAASKDTDYTMIDAEEYDMSHMNDDYDDGHYGGDELEDQERYHSDSWSHFLLVVI